MSEIDNELQTLDQLRLEVLEKCTSLFQHLAYARNNTDNLLQLIGDEHTQFQDFIKQLKTSDPSLVPVLGQLKQEHQRSMLSMDMLMKNWETHCSKSSQDARDLLNFFNQTSDNLQQTTIERDLFDRQSEVLEKIILSHEHISQWKEFVQMVLQDFYQLFPFQFFFIAFAEENCLSLFIYFMGSYSDKVKEKVRKDLSLKMLSGLNLPLDSLLEIEEFDVLTEESDLNESDDIDMLMVNVPEHAPNLAGLLGAAYATQYDLSSKEEAVVRSILSVMVMVVGSSKVLSRTLNELEYYAVHDPLTGLYNRRHFNDMLKYEVGRAGRHHHEFSCVFIDCDDFKTINDSFGHPVGDEVLMEFSNIMQSIIRTGDLAARFGGDEFALLLPETGRNGALIAAEHLREKISAKQFISPDGDSFHSTISLGVVTFPHDGDNIDDLMAYCDMALYKAKHCGKNSSQLYDGKKSLLKVRAERKEKENLLQAIQQDKIVPYFQPIYDCQKSAVFSYEVVARMHDAQGKPIPAFKFIDSIEKNGLARDLDRSIIRNTFKIMREHTNNGHQLRPIFINISAQEMQNHGILDYAIEQAQLMNIESNKVVFELTEREAISDMQSMRKFLDRLKQLGFKFALDDFGSGYNSFHYLRELNFDFVKIDGEFVRNMKTSNIDRSLVKNLSNLCHDLNIQTVAEFIEDDEIYQKVKEFNVDFAQGFHLGLPNPKLLS